MLHAIPMELKEANEYVQKLHRHHAPVYRDKFRLGVCDDEGVLHGVIQIARPKNRILQDGKTLEVVRCCTDGTYNACSFLYSRAARIAKEMGYKKIITYILESECGASLKASGWYHEADTKGDRTWDCPSRPREVVASQLSLFEEKPKYPTENKKRYAKDL